MSTIEDLHEELARTKLAYQMAKQMGQFKAEFLAKASHEIRSPLSSLIGLHQLILSDLCDSPEEQKEFINQAYNSALKLMKLIDEIISVSKVESGKDKLNYEFLSLGVIFEEVYALIHLQVANRNLKLNIDLPQTDIKVYGDRRCLVQLIINLIDAGITLMEEGIINITASAIAESQNVNIAIELNCSTESWIATASNNHQSTQSNSREKTAAIAQNIALSPNMKLLLSQTLIEAMGGNLELLDLSSEDKPLTRIILTCKQAP